MFGVRRAITTTSSRAAGAALPRATQSVRLLSPGALPARKGYATEAAAASSSDGKLQLSLVLPHEVRTLLLLLAPAERLLTSTKLTHFCIQHDLFHSTLTHMHCWIGQSFNVMLLLLSM